MIVWHMILGHHRPRTGVFSRSNNSVMQLGWRFASDQRTEMPLMLNDGEQLPCSWGLIEHIISTLSTSSYSETDFLVITLSVDTMLFQRVSPLADQIAPPAHHKIWVGSSCGQIDTLLSVRICEKQGRKNAMWLAQSAFPYFVYSPSCRSRSKKN